MAKGIHTFFLLMTTATLVIVLFSTWTNETFSRHQPCGVTDADTTSLLMTPADDSAALLSRHEDHVVLHSDVPRKETESKVKYKSANDLPPAMMARDITWSEAWPEVEINTGPGQLSPALHYVWCGEKREFKFQHYLGLLSGLRVLKPLKIYFHYTHSEPVMDKLMYNSWFKEFKEAVPVMDMLKIPMKGSCGSEEMLSVILQVVAKEGGVYLGERVILAGLPLDILHQPFWFAFAGGDNDFTRGVVYVGESLKGNLVDPDTLLKSITSRRSGCISVEQFNEQDHGADRKCLVMADSPKYPRDIWAADTRFAELARWFFYGRRAAYHVQRDPSNPIPRIAHYIRLHSNTPMYRDEFGFPQFLSVLSALYLGGFERVYMHVDRVPTGPWWESLKKENITVIKLQKPSFVYQQKVLGITHFSDISRYNVLYRYGGAYQDFDCVWTTRVPDEMLEYPTVVSPAISQNGQWPDGLAIGMFMARAGAPFIRHAFKGYQDYRGDNYLYNAIMRSYRTYEHYPDTVSFDPHFTVFCANDRCLPRWQRDSYWDLNKDGGRGYNWTTETVSLHLVMPKPRPSLASPLALKNSKNMIGDVGRRILEKSGRLSILDPV